jgi:hypothetical protein
MRNKLIAILVVVVPALCMVPLLNRVNAERTQLRYGGARVTRQIRDQIGQGMAIGLLAGFRGVVADFIWIQSHSRWEKHQWLQQYNDMQIATMLQPQSVLLWDLGAWHMAWNIAYAERVATNNYTAAQGIKRERVWHERGRDFLLRGLQNIPNKYDLYFKLGWLYFSKFNQSPEGYAKAAQYFYQAAQFKEAPTYVGRLYARCLESTGDLKGAYDYWKYLWGQDHKNPHQLWTVIEREIRRIEDELKMPDDNRVFPTKQSTPTTPAT